MKGDVQDRAFSSRLEKALRRALLADYIENGGRQACQVWRRFASQDVN